MAYVRGTMDAPLPELPILPQAVLDFLHEEAPAENIEPILQNVGVNATNIDGGNQETIESSTRRMTWDRRASM